MAEDSAKSLGCSGVGKRLARVNGAELRRDLGVVCKEGGVRAALVKEFKDVLAWILRGVWCGVGVVRLTDGEEAA